MVLQRLVRECGANDGEMMELPVGRSGLLLICDIMCRATLLDRNKPAERQTVTWLFTFMVT